VISGFGIYHIANEKRLTLDIFVFAVAFGSVGFVCTTVGMLGAAGIIPLTFFTEPFVE
jgi:hypothetical protein